MNPVVAVHLAAALAALAMGGFILARRKGSMEAPEEVLLDQPKLAQGKSFYQVRGWSVSEDGRYLAWADHEASDEPRDRSPPARRALR